MSGELRALRWVQHEREPDTVPLAETYGWGGASHYKLQALVAGKWIDVPIEPWENNPDLPDEFNSTPIAGQPIGPSVQFKATPSDNLRFRAADLNFDWSPPYQWQLLRVEIGKGKTLAEQLTHLEPGEWEIFFAARPAADARVHQTGIKK